MAGQANRSSSGKKILVLGATGLIGNACARELIQRGHTITGTCRQSRNSAPNLDGLSLRVVHGDIDAPGQLDAWIQGQDVVIDAAAPYPLHLMFTVAGKRRPTLEDARRRTDVLVECLQRHDAKLVHISTLLAQPTHPGIGLDGLQRQVMRTLHPYFQTKNLIEQRLSSAKDLWPRVMVVQPSACLGPFDIKPREQCLIPKLVCGEVTLGLRHNINVIDTRDVAAGIARAMKGERYGQTIQLTGRNTSLDELLGEIEAISKNPAPRFRYPAALSVLPSYWTEIMWATVGRPSPLPSLLPILICEQGWMKTSETQHELGIAPRPLDETMRDTISWYHDLGYC